MAKNNKNTKEKFNPVKEDKAGIKAKRMVWTTEAINAALSGLDEGRQLIANPFLDNNVKLLKGDLIFKRTDEEKEEWKACSKDIIHFSNSHCRLMTPEGIQNIVLRDYQERYLKHLMEHRLSIYLACRQASKTTTSAIRILHFICFNFDKNVLVVGNKLKTSREVLDKIKKMFVELPYFLRPGVLKWNEGEVAFDNGCRIMTEAAVPEPALGFTLHMVLWDEAAHVAPNIIDEFYNNIFPTITAAKANFMITSTQNGHNLFQRLYVASVAGENEYGHFKTDWDEVPEWNPETRCWEKRDDAWYNLQVANYGGVEAFNKQFGTSFDSNANTLIPNKYLRKISNNAIEFVEKDLPVVGQYFKWHPDYNPIEDLKQDKIIITCDLAEGGGHDYTTFIFNKVINDNGVIKYKTVGMYHENIISLEKSAQILREICLRYMRIYKYYISIEMNTYGELFVHYLKDLIRKDYSDNFNSNVFLKFRKERTINGKLKVEYPIGVKLDSKEKLFGCMGFKSLIEHGLLENNNILFSNELYNFCDENGNNTYKASYGHDDIVMAQMQIAFFERANVYKNFIYEENVVANYDWMNIYEQMNNQYGIQYPDDPDYRNEKDSFYDRIR